MRQIHKIGILMMGVIIMSTLFGCSGNVKYDKYVSKNPHINFTIDYISGWQAVEQIGSFNSFFQICFYEPVIKDKGLRAMMVATVKDSSKVDFAPKNLDGLAADLIKKRMLFKSARILSNTKRKIFGVDAIDMTLNYMLLSKGEQMGQLVWYSERIIIFERSGKFYIVRYGDFTGTFDTHAKAFDHVVKSIKFLP